VVKLSLLVALSLSAPPERYDLILENGRIVAENRSYLWE